MLPTVRADPSIPQDRVRTTCVSKPCWQIAPVVARTRNRPPSIVHRRRDFAPAGESLLFVLPNKSNQNKGASIFHSCVATRRDLSPTAIHRTTEHLLDLLHHSARFASPRGEAKPRGAMRSELLLLGPVGGVEERRALGWRAQHASTTDFGRLFERSERSERSEFCPTPQRPSTAEQSGQRPGRLRRVAFLCLLSLAKQRK